MKGQRRRAVMQGVIGMVLGSMGLGAVVRAQEPKIARTESSEMQSFREVLARPISITLSRVSLRQALDSVSHTANVLVQYQLPLVQGHTASVTVHAKHESLGTVLEHILDGTGLRVAPDGEGDLAIVPVGDMAPDSTDSTGAITGTVIDSATGKPLAKVFVKIEGTKLTGSSEENGRFVLKHVPVGARTLSVRLFGYRPATRLVTISGDAPVTIRVALGTAPTILSGVVTTATGQQERRAIGNDITVLNADSIMRVAPVRNLTDLLDGRVPGLLVQHTSGVPGSPSRLRFRGVNSGLVPSSNHSNDPLLIVDGVPVYAGTSTQRNQNAAAGSYTAPSGYDAIDPNSIEKVEIFKGPSASALYGPNAANGVIVVTTKRGQAGVTRVSSVLDYGINYLPGTYAGPGYYPFGHTFYGQTLQRCSGIDGTADCDVVDTVVQFQALNVPRLSLFGVGNERGGSVNVLGGNGTLTYSFTGSGQATLGYLKMPELYQDQFRIIYNAEVPGWMKRPNTYRTWSGTGNVTANPIPKLQVQLTSQLSSGDQLQSSAQGGISALSGAYVDTTVPQYQTLSQYIQRVTDHQITFNNAFAAQWNRWQSLLVTANAGSNFVVHDDQSVIPYGYVVCSNNTGTAVCNDTSGDFKYGHQQTQVSSARVYAQLFPNAKIRTSAGFDITKTDEHDFLGASTSLQRGIATPSVFASAEQNAASVSTSGWYIAPQLNLNSRFFFSPGFRFDNRGLHGASGSGVTSGGGILSVLPKMDLSWVAIERDGEAALAGFLSQLRPRIAFGTSGTQPDATQVQRLYALGVPDSAHHTTTYEGLQLNVVGNPDLRPARVREAEIGFDAVLWQNRVQLTVTSSYKRTVDDIEEVALPPSAGGRTQTQFRNVGTVRNTSTELTLTLIPIQRALIGWTIQGSYSAVRNVVTKLNDGVSSVALGNGTLAVTGYPLNGRWERPIIGYTDPGPGKRISGNDVYVGDAAAYVGSASPAYQLPFSSSLSLWHGTVLLDANFSYEHGLTQFNIGSEQLLSNLYLDSSASLGQQAAVIAAYCVNHPGIGTCAVEKATPFGLIQTLNVLRMNSVSVSYKVPPSLSRRLRVPSMSVSVQGSNVGLWTGYRGKDPDVNGTPVGEAIEDSGQEPLPRAWRLQINLGN